MTKADKTNESKTSTRTRRPRVCAFLQPTGGAGKTTTVVALTQAINATPGRKALPIDLDPESATLTHHKALKPLQLNVMDQEGYEVDQLAYMQLLEAIMGAPKQGYTDVLLDAGASGFRGLVTWLVTQNPFAFLESIGWDVELHYVIPGNGRKAEAYEDLTVILEAFPTQPIVLWLNPVQEDCRIDGRDFTETEIYLQHQARFKAIVRLRPLNAAFRFTFMRLLQHGLTYDEAMAPAASLVEDILAVSSSEGPPRSSGALAKMPPGLRDPLAPTRVVTIRHWVDMAIKDAPGVL